MNEILRHIISTIKYRFEKSTSGSNQTFSEFRLGKGSRSPREIVHHMYDIIYSTRIFMEQGALPQEELEQLSFEKEIERFLVELRRVDQKLDKRRLDLNYSKKIIQGPFADILSHIGQIALLQRIVDNPIEGEDFSEADIKTGI